MAVKNSIDVFYFACLIPVNVFFAEDGEMDKRVFLSTWKDIPSQNEVQFTLNNVPLNAGTIWFLLFFIPCVSFVLQMSHKGCKDVAIQRQLQRKHRA